jgi:hypothetical protein
MTPLRAKPKRRFAIRLAAVPVLIAALTVPLLSATAPAEAEPLPLDSGSLTWGVRQSWRTYITPANIATADGATADGAGIVTFPLVEGSFEAATGATVLQFAGSARYVNHCGHYPNGTPEDCALDLQINDPRLVIDDERQTLSAHVIQRPAGTGDDAPPLEDLGVVDLVDLDLRGVQPATGDGSTRWEAVPAVLDTAAVPVFGAYQAGTIMDPVTAVYEGPGGLPDFDEEWTPPGTVLMEQTAVHSATGSWAKTNHLFADEANGVVHVVNDLPPTWTPFSTALDATTLAPVGDSGDFGTGLTAGASLAAFDPAGATIFTAATASSPELWALTWQPDTETYARQLIDALPADAGLGSGMVWDASTSRLYLRVRTAGVQYLYAWERDGGAWVRHEYALPQREGWNYNAYYSEAGASAFTAAGDGSLLLARRLARTAANQALYDPTVLRLSFTDGQVVVEEIAGSGTNRPAAEVGTLVPAVVAVADGRVAIVRSHSGQSTSVQFGSIADGAVRLETARADAGFATASLSAAFDPDGGLLWVKNYGNGGHVAIDATGTTVAAFTINGGGFTAPLTATGDHAVLTAWRDAGSVPGTARLDRVAVSPQVTAHPADASVAVEGPEGTTEAVFEAAAAAEPDAQVRWQEKAPDALGYSDIAGATGTTLRAAVDASMDGRQYRAVFANAAGAVATEPAELTVVVEEVPTSDEPSESSSESPSDDPGPSESPSDDPGPTSSTSPDGGKPSVPMPSPTVPGGGDPGATDPGGGPGSPKLPVTGAGLTALIAAAAGLAGTGAVLAAAARKRRDTAASSG